MMSFASSYLALLCVCALLCQLSHAFRLRAALKTTRRGLFSSRDEMEKGGDELWEPDSLFNERLEYVDLSNASPPSDTSRTLPLFLLGAPFFPQGTTYLNVFEMKYRTMMFDISKADEIFGYIHSNSKTGEIASVGTICKVVDRQVLEDGRQNIALEGVGRFRVNKILNTLPYMVAEVEPFLTDAAAEEAEAAKVEKEVFCSLKYYMRLLKSYDKNTNMVVTQATKRNRPGQGLAIDDSVRRTDFSFSIANMIQMADPKESQLLLQTTDVLKRLRVEQKILSKAAEEVSKQLIKSEVLTVDQREEIRAQCFREDDSDEDIMPAEVVEQEQEEA
mmetsp:Transcript_22816/g.51189  ORF Transcript_22816/g.51189 Transcript_22816/m.51189 type:complete len:333 (+) Transcript_22816:130-1128(+)